MKRITGVWAVVILLGVASQVQAQLNPNGTKWAWVQPLNVAEADVSSLESWVTHYETNIPLWRQQASECSCPENEQIINETLDEMETLLATFRSRTQKARDHLDVAKAFWQTGAALCDQVPAGWPGAWAAFHRVDKEHNNPAATDAQPPGPGETPRESSCLYWAERAHEVHDELDGLATDVEDMLNETLP